MRNNKKAYGVEILLVGILVVAAATISSVSAHDEPVKVIYKGCCDDCKKNCTAQGETAAACDAKCADCDKKPASSGTVVVEVVVNTGSSSGGGAATTNSGSGSSSSSGDSGSSVPSSTSEDTAVPSTQTESSSETTTPSEPTSTESTPAQPTPADSTPAQPVSAETSASVEESIKVLCQGAMYKDACATILLKVSTGKGSTEEVIKAGATVALEGITKVFNLTDTLVPKVKSTKKPQTAGLAVDDCKELFQDSIDKLSQFISLVGDKNSYASECGTFKFRLWLSDVLTFADSCMDTLGEADAPEFQNVLKGGVASATEITMSILDVFSAFTHALKTMGVDLNAGKISDALKSYGFGDVRVGSGRRLLGGPSDMLGDDGIPRWLSAADRRLLNIDGERIERELKEKKNKKKKHSKKDSTDDEVVPATPVDPNAAAVPNAATTVSNAATAVPNPAVVPNAVVAQDGSGQFKTIGEALNAYDAKKIAPGGKYVIYVKAGIYDEYILIESKKPNIFIYGDGPLKTIVTGKKSNTGGVPTSKTATFAVQAPNFFAKDMAFENTAGPEGHQAVALRCNNEQQVFLNCHFNAYQDTLYPQGGSQFFRDCLISGTVDFIFGNGATVIQRSTIVVRMPLLNQFNAVTAQGRTGPSMPTGIVIQDCVLQADPRLDKSKIQTFLGRPWKPYARTVFMESDLADLITPEGYRPFEGTPNTEESFYGEYGNIGPSAVTNARVKWPGIKVLSREEAQVYTAGTFLPGADVWLKAANVPFYLGFKA